MVKHLQLPGRNKVVIYFRLGLFQLFNLSEKRYDISQLNPKVSRKTPYIMYPSLSPVPQSDACCVPRSRLRCWTSAGLTTTLRLWTRSAASVKPWTHGSAPTANTWWSFTTRWASQERGFLLGLCQYLHTGEKIWPYRTHLQYSPGIMKYFLFLQTEHWSEAHSLFNTILLKT